MLLFDYLWRNSNRDSIRLSVQIYSSKCCRILSSVTCTCSHLFSRRPYHTHITTWPDVKMIYKMQFLFLAYWLDCILLSIVSKCPPHRGYIKDKSVKHSIINLCYWQILLTHFNWSHCEPFLRDGNKMYSWKTRY